MPILYCEQHFEESNTLKCARCYNGYKRNSDNLSCKPINTYVKNCVVYNGVLTTDEC